MCSTLREFRTEWCFADLAKMRTLKKVHFTRVYSIALIRVLYITKVVFMFLVGH